MTGIPVDLDREPEGVEDGAAQFRVGVGQRLGEVRDVVENLAGGIDVDNAVLALLVGQARERGLCLTALLLQRSDALADDHGVDAGLDCGELAIDALVELIDLAHESLAARAVVAAQLLGQLGALTAEVIEALRTEDAGGEEGVDHLDQRLLTHVLPLAMTERFGRLVAVADPVAAGVVGVVLARLAVHAQRVVAGRTVNDSA